ncbi:hypothetical protein RhiirC2_791772, partial [Rhizophagus irregularis]
NNDYILSRVIDEKRAIRNFLVDGPSFGYSDLRFDIYWFLVNCNKSDYEKQIRENGDGSLLKELEVFQIF